MQPQQMYQQHQQLTMLKVELEQQKFGLVQLLLLLVVQHMELYQHLQEQDIFLLVGIRRLMEVEQLLLVRQQLIYLVILHYMLFG